MTTKVKWHPEAFLAELNITLGNKLEESAIVVDELAKTNCPVKTGALRDSIYQTTDKTDLVSYIGSEKPYAFYVEMGTRKFAPRAYLRRALSDAINKIREIFSST